jgi:hypothetical protein
MLLNLMGERRKKYRWQGVLDDAEEGVLEMQKKEQAGIGVQFSESKIEAILEKKLKTIWPVRSVAR